MKQEIGNPLGLLAVDVDGTLITDRGHITGEVYRALERATREGWVVALASGRSYFAALPVLDELPYVDYAALTNGACLLNVKEDTVLHIEAISPVHAAEIIQTIRDRGSVPALYTTDVRDQSVYYDTLEGACDFFSDYMKTDPRCHMIGDVAAFGGDALQIATVARRDIILRIGDDLKDRPVEVVIVPYESAHIGGKDRDFWFLQVVHQMATKLNGIRRLARLIGIPAGRLVAVGDNYNDAEMISGADVGIAMGNAPDEIKRLAREVVGSNNGSGLAEVVERILFNEDFFPGRNAE